MSLLISHGVRSHPWLSAGMTFGLGVVALVLWPGLIGGLLETGNFEPHGHCFLWDPVLTPMFVGSDMIIGLSYVSISSTLGYFVYRSRADLPFRWVFVAFGIFIVACGATHFVSVVTLWNPVYWLSANVKLVTALASAMTALVLPPLVPRAFKLIETAKLSEHHRRALEEVNAELMEQIRERQRAEDALAHLALHDPLTSLPNRTLLYDRLYQTLRTAARTDASLALMMLDLDRFKDVNDTYGHHVGDLLLQQVAERLRTTLRASDSVARLGGDEFGVLLPSVDTNGALHTADKLLGALRQPFSLEDHDVEIGASIGIGLFPEHGDTAETLMRRADVAMYVAKRDGGGAVLYAPEHDQDRPDRLAQLNALRHAVEREELVLHYQPVVDIPTGRTIGVETLLRWEHPQHGLLSPDEFIPLAEQSGLISTISRWVIQSALDQGRRWRVAGLELFVAVNLSTRDLHDLSLPDTIAELLASSAFPPAQLYLEITESATMVDPQRAVAVLERINAQGVRIAIDDFGTGYSSLGYLHRLPLHQIKIDRSFVRYLEDPHNLSIVRSTIDLGHNLGLAVVAEGVEDQESLDRLTALGCDTAQGYYLSRPMPADAVLQWLEDRRLEAAAPASPD